MMVSVQLLQKYKAGSRRNPANIPNWGQIKRVNYIIGTHKFLLTKYEKPEAPPGDPAIQIQGLQITHVHGKKIYCICNKNI
jgi:hypothetical protein